MKRLILCLLALMIAATAALAEEPAVIEIAEAPAHASELTFTSAQAEAAGGSWTRSKNGELWIALPGARIDWLAYDTKGNLSQWAEQADENTRIIHDGAGAVTSISYTDAESGQRYVWMKDTGWDVYAEKADGTWEIVAHEAPEGVEAPVTAE